jgi:AraC-like DNA-binding protein
VQRGSPSSITSGDSGAPQPDAIKQILFTLGVEPSLTVREAAAVLRWSSSKARRYFRKVEGICICYQPKRFKRAYRTFTIPVSVFAREWQKMTGRQPEAAEIIRERLMATTKQASAA